MPMYRLGIGLVIVLACYLASVCAVNQCTCVKLDVCYEKIKVKTFVQISNLRAECQKKLSKENKKAVSTCEKKVVDEKKAAAKAVEQKLGKIYEAVGLCGNKKFKGKKATTPTLPDLTKMSPPAAAPDSGSASKKKFPSFITSDIQEYLACMKAGIQGDPKKAPEPTKDPWLCPKSESPLDVIKKIKQAQSSSSKPSGPPKRKGPSPMKKLIKCAADQKCCVNLNSNKIIKQFAEYKKLGLEEQAKKVKTDVCKCLGTELGVDAETVTSECGGGAPKSKRKRAIQKPVEELNFDDFINLHDEYMNWRVGQ